MGWTATPDADGDGDSAGVVLGALGYRSHVWLRVRHALTLHASVTTSLGGVGHHTPLALLIASTAPTYLLESMSLPPCLSSHRV